MASGRRPGARSARSMSVAISSRRVARTRPSAAPSPWRISESEVSAAAKPAITAASAARRSASFSSVSVISITPLSPSSPSREGGDALTLLPKSRTADKMASRTGVLTRTVGAAPLRSTVRLACTEPRPSVWAARARTGSSTASQPAGVRSRTSKPLPLTDLISQLQA